MRDSVRRSRSKKRLALKLATTGVLAGSSALALGAFSPAGAQSEETLALGQQLNLLWIVIGAILVAVGTSLPEMVTVILSRLRGHDDVGVGTLLGSNLFNGLAIVGIAGTIHPIAAPMTEVALTLACGIVALLLLLPDRSGLIVRGRGFLLLMLYVCFVWATLTS